MFRLHLFFRTGGLHTGEILCLHILKNNKTWMLPRIWMDGFVSQSYFLWLKVVEDLVENAWTKLFYLTLSVAYWNQPWASQYKCVVFGALMLCLFSPTIFVVFIFCCEFLGCWWLTRRASEQKYTGVTEHLNGSFPQQVDLDLYLGIYAGEARWALIALCVFWMLQSFIEQIHSSLAVAQGLRGPGPLRPNLCLHGSQLYSQIGVLFFPFCSSIPSVIFLFLSASSFFQVLCSQQ